MNNKKFGQRLKSAIEMRGLTTKQFAESIKVSASTIGTIISGKRKPSIDVFYSIVQTLDIPPEYLLQDSIRQAEKFYLSSLLNDNFMELPVDKRRFIEKLCDLIVNDC